MFPAMIQRTERPASVSRVELYPLGAPSLAPCRLSTTGQGEPSFALSLLSLVMSPTITVPFRFMRKASRARGSLRLVDILSADHRGKSRPAVPRPPRSQPFKNAETLGPKSFTTSRPYVFVYESIHVYVCEEGGQPGRIGLFLPPNGRSWELNSGHEAWWQVPSPAETSHLHFKMPSGCWHGHAQMEALPLT